MSDYLLIDQVSDNSNTVKERAARERPSKVPAETERSGSAEGSAVRLECRGSAFPEPFIIWSKNGKQLKDGPKYRCIFEDPDLVALVVRDGVLDDLGRYTVTIKDPSDQTSGSACIIVEVPAKVNKGPENVKTKVPLWC
ncbi:putative CAVP-target protein-like [Triplophysa rosa]|uniref:CAVP-target protein-like n=1 Tax=Triplophysa rosa TaxID=992332 RepID=A0A9W7WTN3_TRIRA|nr:putative CAVP-target protein-like [Triplophysa rosa]